MRKKLVAGNWKMNLDLTGAVRLAEEIKEAEHSFQCDVMLIPPFVFLSDVREAIYGSGISLGAQNCSVKEAGAFTGEVSAAMLASVGAQYVIIGHSERRVEFNETNDVLREKIKVALKYGLQPVFCCGEPLMVRNENMQEPFVQQQLEESLAGFTTAEIEKVIIAYEPIWAIGTGLNATPEQAQNMHLAIRKFIEKLYTHEIAAKLRILYGGSCKPANARELFLCPDVDGGLIGGASLNAKDFIAIIQAA